MMNIERYRISYALKSFEKFANTLAAGDERYIEERIRTPEPEISLPEKPRSNDEPERLENYF